MYTLNGFPLLVLTPSLIETSNVLRCATLNGGAMQVSKPLVIAVASTSEPAKLHL